MAKATNFPVEPWQKDGLQPYDKYEAIDGTGLLDPYFYYATTDVPAGLNFNPSGVYSYNVTSISFKDSKLKYLFTQTGDIFFQPGSMVGIDGLRGYSGQIINGGDGFVEIIRPAWNEDAAYTAVIKSTVHPYWTIGFPSTPDYTSSLKGSNSSRTVSFGDGYSQRQGSFINSNGMQFDLVFKNRKDKEALSIMNFVEDKAGVTPFALHLPNHNIFKESKMLVVAAPYSHTMNSFNLSDITIPVTKVFDIT